jgi:ribosome-associated protein
MDHIDAVKIAKNALEDKKAIDIKILDLRKLSSVAEFFVIASGNNINQLKAMGDNVEAELGKNGVVMHHSEGHRGGEWVLLDFNGMVVHLFIKEQREFYDLDRIWADAEIIE